MKLTKKYTIDFGKCNPNHNGSNLELIIHFHKTQPYDTRGSHTLLNNSNRNRFNNYSYIAAATNLETGKNRYDALLFGAILCCSV